MWKRYELSDRQWQCISALVPGKPGDPGRTGVDNRLFMNGVLWVLRSGARWHDLPERYGNWKTAHKRFTRWARAGVWERIFAALISAPDNDYLMLDSTLVRVHQQAATGKGGGKNQALGRSRGGLTTKIHLATAEGSDCFHQGCRARRACAAGRDVIDEPMQAGHHMTAFLRVNRLQ